MGPQLVASLQAILKKYNGKVSNITVGKVTIMCSGAESLAQMQKDFKIGEAVPFMYYIGK
ncbi:MAG: hypothetical protein GZ094_00030 [Mariniphaga sp.]|nr:hypothetical protein [Mariniphaga sp.]